MLLKLAAAITAFVAPGSVGSFRGGRLVPDSIRPVLRDHLDPEDRYLGDAVVAQHQCIGAAEVWSLSWSADHPRARIMIAVAADPMDLDSLTEAGWTWQEFDARGLPRVESARIARFDTGFAALVQRIGGERVLLVAGRSEDDPSPDVPFGVDDLIEAAADLRIGLGR